MLLSILALMPRILAVSFKEMASRDRLDVVVISLSTGRQGGGHGFLEPLHEARIAANIWMVCPCKPAKGFFDIFSADY